MPPSTELSCFIVSECSDTRMSRVPHPPVQKQFRGRGSRDWDHHRDLALTVAVGAKPPCVMLLGLGWLRSDAPCKTRETFLISATAFACLVAPSARDRRSPWENGKSKTGHPHKVSSYDGYATSQIYYRCQC